MCHCIESGYGVVSEGGRAHLFDPDATPKVAAVLKGSDAHVGVYVRAERRLQGGEMVTVAVSAAQLRGRPSVRRSADPVGPRSPAVEIAQRTVESFAQCFEGGVERSVVVR